jgi:hypothetical protein
MEDYFAELRQGFEEVTLPDSGLTYYVQTDTQRATWVR